MKKGSSVAFMTEPPVSRKTVSIVVFDPISVAFMFEPPRSKEIESVVVFTEDPRVADGVVLSVTVVVSVEVITVVLSGTHSTPLLKNPKSQIHSFKDVKKKAF